MGAQLSFDMSKIEDAVRKGCLSTQEITEIVEIVATNFFNSMVKEIPIAQKNSKGTWKYYQPTQVRVYPDQSWITIKFDADWEVWKHLYFHDKRVDSPHYGWYTKNVKKFGDEARRELIAMAKQRIGK